jgi:DNA-directed RNA polymerase subunit RPC12/RpoP
MIKGTCPVCNGLKRVPAGDSKYKSVIAGYDKETDTVECRNCGGQYMFGRPTGEVRLNKEDVPCTHVYQSKTVGRCLTEYTCIHCDERFEIDSGD